MHARFSLHLGARHWRAWLFALLFAGGQFGAWIHLASHHAGEKSTSEKSAARLVPGDADTTKHDSEEDDTCLICLGIAAFSIGLVGHGAKLHLLSPTHGQAESDDSTPCALAPFSPVARGPPRFS